MLDNKHLSELMSITSHITQENVGNLMEQAIVLKAAISDMSIRARADKEVQKIRDFARKADLGWKAFEVPIRPKKNLKEENIWQLMAIIGTLMDLNYCFERVEETSFYTFENSAPVRFYVNGIFHYLSALFLLDVKGNLENGLPKGGTVIKVLHPIGLGGLLDPIYKVFERPFGDEKSYGETILRVRNRNFVHGSFSPKNIKALVKDTRIFDENQRWAFFQNHLDLFDRLIVFRLQLVSIVTAQSIDINEYSPAKLYHL